MLRIIDTYNEIQRFFKTECFDIAQYKTYASNISPNLWELVREDTKEYDFEKDIFPVLQYLFGHRELAAAAHDSFQKTTALLETTDLLRDKIDATVIFYMGLCSGAGWVTTLDGKTVVLLGVEKMVELNWTDELSMIGLLYHELGHVWHFQNRKTETSLRTPKQQALWQLYSEGMAMYFEHLLMNDPKFYHQDKNGWLDWCSENKQRIAREYLRRIENNESCQDFFGDWCNFEGRSDVGYFLGCEVIRFIRETHTVEEMLDLDLDAFEDYLNKYAM